MKKLIVLFVVCMFFVPGIVFSTEAITLQWNPNPESDLAGYKVFMSNESGVYDYANPILTVGADKTTCNVPISANGHYYFVIKAFDTEIPSLESEDSNEADQIVDWIGRPGRPSGLGCMKR